MDFLLIVLTIGGFVFAGVMLALASRTSRMERESDARVHRLQALATGSVLFSEPPVEWASGPVELGDEGEQPAPARTFDFTADVHPFVMTVPAGADRVTGGFSFNRTPRRSQR
jgi:hypothetical protein